MFDNPEKTLDELQQELLAAEDEALPEPRKTPSKTAKRKQADYEAILQQAAAAEKPAPSSRRGLFVALILEIIALVLAVVWWKL